jgi:hypothetical protein
MKKLASTLAARTNDDELVLRYRHRWLQEAVLEGDLASI